MLAGAPTPLERWVYEGSGAPSGRVFAGLDPFAQALLLATLSERTPDQCLFAVFAQKARAHEIVELIQFLKGPESKDRVHHLSALDFDFYRGLLPDLDKTAERNVALFHALNDPAGRIFVTTGEALLQKAMPPERFLDATQVLKPNEEIERDLLALRLQQAGYQRQPVAYDPGTFSVRGGVVDIFCPLYQNPLRVEYFGDLIESLRFFDETNQRSLDDISEAHIIPIHQAVSPTGDALNATLEDVKSRLDHQGLPKPERDAVMDKIREGSLGGQVAFLFPLLCGGSQSMLDYLPEKSQIFWEGRENLINNTLERDRHKLLKNHVLYEDANTPVSESETLFLTEEDFTKAMDREESHFFEAFSGADDSVQVINGQKLSFAAERDASKSKGAATPMLQPFATRFKQYQEDGYAVHIVSHTRTHAERAQLLFAPYGMRGEIHGESEAALKTLLRADPNHLHFWRGFVGESGVYPNLRLVVLSEEEIFGQKRRAARSSVGWKGPVDATKAITSFRELKEGDYVVHKDQGIGKYLGLRSMEFQGIEGDYVLLEYKDGDKLYVPVYRLNLVQKFVGGEDAKPALDKMGGERWAKAKKKAQKAATELAAEFLEIQAKRKLIPAPKLSEPGAEYTQFEMAFPFDETPDQQKAIDDVMHDLSAEHPMDRLVVGDVGYGKTEVAMRAAYRAAADGFQAAVLVPTTVLAFQHFNSFKERFKDTAIRVEMISRLRTSKQNKETVENLRKGMVDVVVGTHRILSQDVVFKNLGLVVIDEEHRFGVVHKEKLKKMSESVHCLSMTATPIPRTLNMAMAGIKDISLITTPPPDRLAIRTFVCRNSDEVIAEAISNELSREGQVFFVHNRIQSMEKVKEQLSKLFPKIKIETAHGQMDATTLEKKMLSFMKNESQLLLTTSIIESGIDISRVNTIILDDAHKLGLAQMYQLRGRVGRSDRRAYCYLLAPGEGALTEDAKSRLQAIARHSDLGSGFNIASHDLEIRGAGDLLGADQSGHISAVGIELYFELLEESVRMIRGEKKKSEVEPDINLRIPAFFPHDYLPDVSERIVLYRRLSSVEDEDTIANIEEEIRDRFGTLPEEVVNLLGLMRIKLYLKKMHVTHMKCGPKRASLQFAPTTPVSPADMVQFVQSDPKRYSLTPDQKFVFEVGNTEWKALLEEVQQFAIRLNI